MILEKAALRRVERNGLCDICRIAAEIAASFDKKSTRRPRRLNSERRSVISESNDYPHGRQSIVT